MEKPKPYYKRHGLKGVVIYVSKETLEHLHQMAYEEDRTMHRLLHRIIKEAIIIWQQNKKL